jgi:hypothetical protein
VGENNEDGTGLIFKTSTITSGGLTVPAGAAESISPALSVVEVFSAEPVTNIPTTNPPTTTGVPSTGSGQTLWGTAATATIGAFLSEAIAEQRRKWEEEIKAKEELREQQEEEKFFHGNLLFGA